MGIPSTAFETEMNLEAIASQENPTTMAMIVSGHAPLWGVRAAACRLKQGGHCRLVRMSEVGLQAIFHESHNLPPGAAGLCSAVRVKWSLPQMAEDLL